MMGVIGLALLLGLRELFLLLFFSCFDCAYSGGSGIGAAGIEYSRGGLGAESRY